MLTWTWNGGTFSRPRNVPSIWWLIIVKCLKVLCLVFGFRYIVYPHFKSTGVSKHYHVYKNNMKLNMLGKPIYLQGEFRVLHKMEVIGYFLDVYRRPIAGVTLFGARAFTLGLPRSMAYLKKVLCKNKNSNVFAKTPPWNLYLFILGLFSSSGSTRWVLFQSLQWHPSRREENHLNTAAEIRDKELFVICSLCCNHLLKVGLIHTVIQL